MMKKQRKPQKSWSQMSLEELREATREYDKPLPAKAARPMSPANRKRWQRARRSGFRSVYVGRKRTLTIEVEPAWLKRLDRYAAEHGMTREELIERSLRGALAFAEG